jgi:hypothetical protein
MKKKERRLKEIKWLLFAYVTTIPQQVSSVETGVDSIRLKH